MSNNARQTCQKTLKAGGRGDSETGLQRPRVEKVTYMEPPDAFQGKQWNLCYSPKKGNCSRSEEGGNTRPQSRGGSIGPTEKHRRWGVGKKLSAKVAMARGSTSLYRESYGAKKGDTQDKKSAKTKVASWDFRQAGFGGLKNLHRSTPAKSPELQSPCSQRNIRDPEGKHQRREEGQKPDLTVSIENGRERDVKGCKWPKNEGRTVQ